ncbi:serine/threonine-protein kinase [Bacteroides pyogenes]|uniref:serine/threonine-protein kinase n=1 Tax=Bacteroides pyogenes TaxID=310300 RepID=UPI001F2D8FD8|nr:serine/threonine-protein kinase [Bacteroides pyogenes]
MKCVVNSKYKEFEEYVRQLPFSFDTEGEVIYDERNVLKRIRVKDMDWVVKRFKKPNVINRIVYSFFRKSKALRSFVYSEEILRRGFDTPDPVAALEEYTFGLLGYSYYICAHQEGETVRALMKGEVSGNESELRAFAEYTASLHQKGVIHLDYSPGNILISRVNGGYSFSLIDVNRMKFIDGEVDRETAAFNLRRLCISRDVLGYVATCYAAFRGWADASWVKKCEEMSDRFFAGLMYKIAFRNPVGRASARTVFRFKLYRSLRRMLPSASSAARRLFAKESELYNRYFAASDLRAVYKELYARPGSAQ